jgi:hypothetical protein
MFKILNAKHQLEFTHKIIYLQQGARKVEFLFMCLLLGLGRFCSGTILEVEERQDG